MIERIIRYSLTNRVVIVVLFSLVAVWGVWALYRTPVDAIPDLSDNQVIVMADWMGRAPQVVQDQVTYPLTTAFQGLPRVKAVRSQTMFGLSMIYIIFPIAVPGILSAGIFAFTLSWNEFLYALIFLSSPSKKTVPVGVVSELIRGDVYFWGQLMAGALLGSIPVALVYSFLVEYYVAGMTGSVKG